jgi:amidase
MERRSFLTTATIASAALSTFLVSSCIPSIKKNEEIVDSVGDSDTVFELNEETISSIREKLSSGKYSSEQIVKMYLDRIEAIDRNGIKLNAVIEVNPDAIALAKTMDLEMKEGKSRGPLHGIPILIKDNIDTGDKMQTTAGSLALVGNIASNDAFVIKKIREAGAIIIGKTNLSEWANFRSTSSCSGWSSMGGQTKNPYILDHNPCGSSAGSGVAVAANLCVVAIGTETDGSVVCPASVSGIVGIKPTVGLVSRTGIIPISSTQDTAGPMARTVTDAAILLGAMTAIDDQDRVTLESKGRSHTDYTVFLDADGLSGKRIGVERKPQGKNQFMHALQQKTIDLLKSKGATIIEIDYLDEISKLGEEEFEVMQYEFKAGVNSYLSSSNAKIKSLKEVIDFNNSNEDKAMPYFKQETLISSNEKGSLTDKKYIEALNKSHCSIDMIYGDRWGDVFLTMPAAVSGYPHITVPCGMVYDLPVGFSFFGSAYSEPKLISIAYAYEQASKERTKPSFKKSFL